MKQFYKNDVGTIVSTSKEEIYDPIIKECQYQCYGFNWSVNPLIEIKFFEKTFHSVDETTNVYLNLLDKYKDLQMIVAVEELSELQKEVCKALRNKKNKENLYEEIADVEIMLEQMKLYFGIDENALEYEKQVKIKRTIERCLKDES